MARAPGRRNLDGTPQGGVLLNTPDAIRDRIIRIYTSVSPGGRRPRDGEAGELDSLAFLEFIVQLEQEFGIVIETRDIEEENFATTASTTAYVRRKIERLAA